MKLLLDMNMPGVWIDFLRAAGFTAVHWRDIGDIRAEDHEIMSWARENGYVVLTHDLDFGALLYLTEATAPSVVQLRAEHILPQYMGDAVLEALDTATEPLAEGALIVIDPRRHRIRLLPLRG
jgi:predicted nuclease of predicted toxin-antitoxin system